MHDGLYQNSQHLTISEISELISELSPEELDIKRAEYTDASVRNERDKERVLQLGRIVTAQAFEINLALSLIEDRQHQLEATVDKTD